MSLVDHMTLGGLKKVWLQCASILQYPKSAWHALLVCSGQHAIVPRQGYQSIPIPWVGTIHLCSHTCIAMLDSITFYFLSAVVMH